MKIFTLDFAEVKTYLEMHECFKTAFHLPDYYGRNMDALWDCLYCSYDENTTIYVKNCAEVSAELQSEVELMKELFQELQQALKCSINSLQDFSRQLLLLLRRVLRWVRQVLPLILRRT